MRKVLIISVILIALVIVSGCISPRDATGEGINVREFTLLTEDGTTISVSHFLYGQPDVCILAHGLMGSKHRPYITRLSERLSEHFDIITFDFRGHGASGGVCNGMTEFYDIKAVIDYAKNNGYKEIALIGFSLGGIEGIYAVAKFHDIDALVTVSTPADVEAIRPYAKWLFWMANNWFGRVILRIWVRLDYAPEFPKPITVIDQVSPIPILIVHGREDTFIDFREAEILYQKAKEPKELVIIEGMKHPPDLPDEFYDTVENWLEGLLR